MTLLYPVRFERVVKLTWYHSCWQPRTQPNDLLLHRGCCSDYDHRCLYRVQEEARWCAQEILVNHSPGAWYQTKKRAHMWVGGCVLYAVLDKPVVLGVLFVSWHGILYGIAYCESSRCSVYGVWLMTCEENKQKHGLCTQVHIQIVNIFYAIRNQKKNSIYAAGKENMSDATCSMQRIPTIYMHLTLHDNQSKSPVLLNLYAHLTRLKQQLTLRSRFLLKPFRPREHALTA